MLLKTIIILLSFKIFVRSEDKTAMLGHHHQQEQQQRVSRNSFPFAGQPDLVRANQKDLFYVKTLHENVNGLISSLLGSRVLMRWSREIQLSTDAIYYTATTLAGIQTLGEEYVDILQVSSNGQRIGSRRRRLLVAAHVILPYVIDFLYERILAKFHCSDEITTPAIFSLLTSSITTSYSPLMLKRLLLLILLTSKQLINGLSRAHLAYFYFTGDFYRISSRLTDVRYIVLRRLARGGTRPNYFFLGVLTALQLIIALIRWMNQAVISLKNGISSTGEMENIGLVSPSDQKTQEEHVFVVDEDETRIIRRVQYFKDTDTASKADRNDFICALCLDMRRYTTATPCGHIFCWYCICEWCSNKPECPLCRHPVNMNNLHRVY